MNRWIFIMLVYCAPLILSAQTDTIAVKSIEGITNKMLELISGPIGQERDWDEYRSLFIPRAQKVFINKKAPPGRQVRVMNSEEFIRQVGPLYSADGFEEYAIGLTINEFNGIAQVFQSFYCKNLKGTYEKRGINSFQLVYSDERWWIASTTFSNETEDSLVPNNYLFKEYQIKK